MKIFPTLSDIIWTPAFVTLTPASFMKHLVVYSTYLDTCLFFLLSSESCCLYSLSQCLVHNKHLVNIWMKEGVNEWLKGIQSTDCKILYSGKIYHHIYYFNRFSVYRLAALITFTLLRTAATTISRALASSWAEILCPLNSSSPFPPLPRVQAFKEESHIPNHSLTGEKVEAFNE